MKRWLAKRSTVARLESQLVRSEARVRDQQASLARLGHARDEAYREAARTMQDLRLIRVHLQTARPERVAVTLEFADAMLVDGYRRDGTFSRIVAAFVDEALMREYAGMRRGVFA